MTDTDAATPGSNHVPVLDGVRALSILLVLATHWLPMNALWWQAGTSVGMLGMAFFFVLSGYLITIQLLRRGSALSFAIQRLARVLPLAWLCAGIVGFLLPMEGLTLLSHLLFYANLPPQTLTHPLDHYWSLCVELQFYAVATVLLVLRPGFSGAVILSLLFAVTAFRVITNSTSGSVTWVRADDILAGAALAWLMHATRTGRSGFAPSLPCQRCLGCPFCCCAQHACCLWTGISSPTFVPTRRPSGLVRSCVNPPALPRARWHTLVGVTWRQCRTQSISCTFH